MGIGFKKNQQFNILCSVFEDNAGALSLANLELPRMTPNTMQENCTGLEKPENIKVLELKSKLQLADIFTKGLPKSTFKTIREQLMGL